MREAVSLGASRIEVAHSRYYGGALKNRAALRRSGRRSPKYGTVSSRNRPLTGARIETRARPLARLSEALDRHRASRLAPIPSQPASFGAIFGAEAAC